MNTKFDRQKVIDKATNLFWKKGFHATSMRNLQDVIDMRPGSIYASFGSKEALYKEALLHYAETSLAGIKACREEQESPLTALKLVITSIVSECSKSPSGMCMLMKSIAELTDENAELLSEAQRLMGVLEEAFVDLLKEAIEKGELPESKDPQRMARFIQVQLMGMRAYARATDGEIPVEEFIDDALACLRWENPRTGSTLKRRF